MIDLLINKDGSRKNRLGIFNVGGYVTNLMNLSDRALFNRIADGVDNEYEASNKSIREVMQSMRTDSQTDDKYNTWVRILSNSKTHPIRKRKTKAMVEPTIELENKLTATDRDILVNQKFYELFELIAKEYGLQGNLKIGKIKIKTDAKDKLNIRLEY